MPIAPPVAGLALHLDIPVLVPDLNTLLVSRFMNFQVINYLNQSLPDLKGRALFFVYFREGLTCQSSKN
jgi:hypothetical protein